MSIDSVLGRMGQLQSRIGAIQHRVEEISGRPFAGAMARAAQKSPLTDVPAPSLALGPSGDAPLATPQPPGAMALLASEAATRHQLDPALVQAVMKTESNGNPQATSPVGAMGLMQLMPGTAKDLGVTNPYDARQNVEGGAKYLGDLTKRYGLELGVAAYNAGPAAVEKYNGVPPFPETQAYVKKVMGLYEAYKK